MLGHITLNLDEHMKNIAIVESYLTTRTWVSAINNSSLLVSYIICAQKTELGYYIKHGIPAERICDISIQKFDSLQHENAEFYETALRYEKLFSVKLNRIISMDRILKEKSYDQALCYLGFIAQCVDTFLIKHNISVIFQEPTWAQEIVIAEVAKVLKIKNYFPQTVRIPSARSCFFEYLSFDEMYRREHAYNMEDVASEAFVAVVNKGKKPDYFYLEEPTNIATRQNFISLFRQIGMMLSGKRNSMCTPSLLQLIFSKVKTAILRKVLLKTSLVFSSEIVVPSSYILITLHVQPESSIDVYGNTFANQIEFVQAISKTTPARYKILVKEHLPSVGCRPKGFYKELSKISGVVLVGPKEDSHQLIKKASMVISATGTSCFEAALLGVPAVTATKMYFSDLMVVDQFNPYKDSVEDLLLMSSTIDNSPQNRIKKLERILCHSFEGTFADSRSYEAVAERENIEKIRFAFEEVVGCFS